jgi:squalene-hopene/tetraprenyl-beta-curcumene cyclase
MTSKNWFRFILSLAAFILFIQPFGPYNSAKGEMTDSDRAVNQKALEAIDRGLEWLKSQQTPDGLFHDHPGLTGLAISAFLRHPLHKYKEADQPFIQKSISVLVKMQQPDGAIYDIKKQPALPNYNTSIALMALSDTKNPKYKEAITKAQNFIKGLQVQDAKSVYYGGIGYGSKESVYDLSNLNLAIQALKESGSNDQQVWDKAIKFLERCQNSSETNDQSWAGDDGGFIYAPDGESKAGVDENGKPKSYASMTYAGLLSFIYANFDKNDPRVQGAVDWVKKHFTLEENYGMGKEGLYYNYHTMAKALDTYGQPKIEDALGNAHDWYKELVEKLASEQNPQGFWKNDASRWMESDPVLVTSYAILALEAAYRQ